MARMPRIVVPGQPLHVIQRGNNRLATFHQPSDHARYLEVLESALTRAGAALHAYVLMTNHVHLLLTPSEGDSAARLIQRIGRFYVRYVNHRYSRTGTLWESRYRSSLIDSERYFLTCMRYIELNPVRAGIVAHPSAYRWSSHPANALGTYDPLLTPHPLYRALGRSADQRRSAYRSLFRREVPERDLASIRHATQRGDALGEASFLEGLARQLGRPVVRQAQGGWRERKAGGAGGAGDQGHQGVRVTENLAP